jgi:tight adherence protein C
MGSAEFLLVGGLLSAAYAVYSFVFSIMSNGQNDKDLLSWASGNEPVKSKSALVNWSRPLIHQFTLKYALKYKNETTRKRLHKLILTSGLSREMNVDEFIGMQILWGVMIPALFAILNFALQFGFSPYLFLIISPVGFLLPRWYATQEKKAREISVRADLPFFTDLLALSTEAGLDFISAIQRIVDKAEGSVLADELGNVLRDIKLGSSRADALKGMASRLDISEITSFVAVLVDADATGASISQVLKDQSVQIRLERFVRAEKAGARASQLMLFPMMIFIMPAVFLVLLGPVILQFIYGSGGN